MANEFKYTIRADDRSKPAVQSAKREMRGMEDSAKKLGNVLKGAFTVGAIIAVGRTVSKITRELVDAYAVQERAERKLAAAVNANPLMDGRAADRLEEFAAELQKVTTLGDETTIDLAAMAVTWGRNEEEIKRLITTAADLSTTLGIDLQTAARGVNNVMEGNISVLSRYIPELRNLSEEQIANGEAMELLEERFGGMSEEMRNTTEGSLLAFNNAWGDLKEILGEELAPAFTNTLNFLTDLVAKTGEFVGQIFELKNSFNALDRVINPNATSMAELVIFGESADTYERALIAQAARIEEVRRQLGQKQDSRREAVSRGAANTAVYDRQIQDILNLLSQEENLEAQLVAAREAAIEAESLHTAAVAAATTAQEEHNEAVDGGAAKAAFLASLFDETGKSVTGVRKILIEQESALEDVNLQFGNLNLGTNALYDSIVANGNSIDFFGQQTDFATNKIQEFGESLTDFGAGDGGAAGTRFGDVSIRSLAPGVEGLEGMLGGLGETMSAALGPIGILVAEFMKLMSNIKAVQELLAPLGIVLDGILAVLGPVLNEGLAPLVGIFHMIGQVIGHLLLPVLELLFPIIQAMANAFVWLYNKAFVPVYNVLREFGNRVYNFFVDLVNWVIRALNSIPFVNIGYVSKRGLDHGKLDEIDTGDLAGTGTDYLGEGGSPASYTTGRNITVNMVVNTDALVGEDGIREFALMIRDEIYSAEALGA